MTLNSLNPLASELGDEIGGEHFIVEAGVVDKLPVSVLLGWDVPQLEDLFQDGSTRREALQTEDTMAVMKKKQRGSCCSSRQRAHVRSCAPPSSRAKRMKSQSFNLLRSCSLKEEQSHNCHKVKNMSTTFDLYSNRHPSTHWRWQLGNCHSYKRRTVHWMQYVGL